jgi:23S rRNA pseudouridine2605 synthase
MRLHLYLARCGIASRRKAEEFIQEGRVTVNNKVVRTLGTVIDPEKDQITFDGKKVTESELKIFRFWKPRGLECTLKPHSSRETLADVQDFLQMRIFSVGRLDVDVSGILILTNDGEFAEKLQHPRYEVPRTYVARVEEKLSREALMKLLTGVQLEDGLGQALEANIISHPSRVVRSLIGSSHSSEDTIELVVTEGRNRFVKRILDAVGHPVIALSRIGFGNFNLDGLKEGEIIELSSDEVKQAKSISKN